MSWNGGAGLIPGNSGSGGGGGSVSDITSTGGSITITGPTGPTTNLEVALPVVGTEVAETNQVPLIEFKPSDFGTVPNPWLMVGYSETFNATQDNIMFLGWNAATGAGSQVANQPAYYIGWESRYNSGTTTDMEFYLAYVSADGTTTSFRPFSVDVARSDSTSNAASVLIDIGAGTGTNTTGFSVFQVQSTASFPLIVTNTLGTTLYSNGGEGGLNSEIQLTNTNSAITFNAQGSNVVSVYAAPTNLAGFVFGDVSNVGALTNYWHYYKNNGTATLLLYDSINSRIMVSYIQGANSGAANIQFNSNIQVAALAIHNGGTATQNSSTVTNPATTSGSKVTPNSNSQDCMVYVPIAATTTGTVKITVGPSTGAENTIVPTSNLVALSEPTLSFRVPGGWSYVVTITGTTVAIGTVTAVSC